MRRASLFVLLPLVMAAGVGLSVLSAGRATAEDPIPPTPEMLLKRIQALELEVQYLRARDVDVTAYLLETRAHAQSLAQSLRTAREQGFTAGAISSTSREALLSGLEGHAERITRSLPEITRGQKELLDQAQRLR
jgi:hypothetical protein